MVNDNGVNLILSALTIAGGFDNSTGMKFSFNELKRKGKLKDCENQYEILSAIYHLHTLQLHLVSHLIGREDTTRNPATALAEVQLDTNLIMDILNISDDDLIDAAEYVTERNDHENDI